MEAYVAQFWDGEEKKRWYSFVEGEKKTISDIVEPTTKKVKDVKWARKSPESRK